MIYEHTEDLTLRVHQRSLMEASGLQRILTLCGTFGYEIKGRTKSTKATRFSEAQNGRSSQFMDADESIEQEQIQQQLAEGVRLVSTSFRYGHTRPHSSDLPSTLQGTSGI